MATDWAVTTAAENIKLDSERKNSTQFTVSNPGRAADRAVFDILPGEGADDNWFRVDQPQRLVNGGDSVSYIVVTTVPANASAGAYSYQAMVYSANVPPEENSRLSPRITFDVAAPAPAKKKTPWLLFGIIAAVLVVLVVGALVALGRHGSSPVQAGATTPSAAATGPVKSVTVKVPKVSSLSEADAVKLISSAGLKPAVRHKQDASLSNVVITQNPPPGAAVSAGTVVSVDVAISFAQPVLSTPLNGSTVRTAWPDLTWQAVPGAAGYQVTIAMFRCPASGVCGSTPAKVFNASGTSFTPSLPVESGDTAVQWTVKAVDDFGTAGPLSKQYGFDLIG
jgi:hypothetical protein